MITAIPMTDNRVSSHFTKAQSLVFLDEQGTEIHRQANPALDANCSGKQKLLELITEYHAERVVVRNIGSQMLGKLLARQLSVFQTRCGRRQPQELAHLEASGLLPLTDSSQGRQSLHHAAKSATDSCCGHHGADHHDHAGRCGQQVDAAPGSCCAERKGQGSCRQV
jgi:predicted Fe-Mo cluster-binding NifX family protein